MTTFELLMAARELISDPKNWCQGAGGRDENGRGVRSDDSSARQWCALGALAKVFYRHYLPMSDRTVVYEATEKLESVARKLYNKRVVVVNDRVGHSAVMAVYDEALK